ncbi:MAG: hypothetical protein IMZ64_08095, partial [Bacteroidetes bacterium]|nr:hypothetical protein [Bacteroidota bacterium]
VFSGDEVFDTINSYLGIVLSRTSATALVTAMFDISNRASEYASWGTSTTYLIQPQPRFKLVLDAPSLTAGHTITVEYLKRPSPVYSDYGTYSFAVGFEEALIKYAIWLYKYRDSKPEYGDALYKFYDMEVRKAKNIWRRATGAVGFRVSFKKDS